MTARAVAALFAALSAAAAATAEDRFRLILNGAFDPAEFSYSEARRFDLFVEQARLDTRYDVGRRVGFDGAFQFDLTRSIGLMAGFTTLARSGEATFAAELPHPLFFGAPRALSGSLSGLSFEERAMHASLVVGHRVGRLDLAAFGGATFFRVDAQLLGSIEFDQVYPFDRVTLAGTPRLGASDSPVGVHVGARFDVRLSTHFGVGVQARYSSATARLALPGVAPFEVDLAAVQLAAGARIYF